MDLVFDIGCNMGDFSKAFNEHWDPKKIIQVDANPSMEFIAADNRGSNMVFHNYVMTDTNEGMTEFFIDPSQTGVSTASEEWMTESRFAKGSKYLPPDNVNWRVKINIKNYSLDSLIEDYGKPDFIKIDVEGYEMKVLEGLSQKVGEISFEWREEDYWTVGELCVDRLRSLGYLEFGMVGFFEEGDVCRGFTYSDKGDDYLLSPKEYHNIYTFDHLMMKLINEDRRINYGMIFAR